MPRIASMPFRLLLSKLNSRRNIAPIIASSGRAGSTMLNDAAAAAMLGWPWLANFSKPRVWSTETAWNMDATNYRRGVVYKTHDYPPSARLPPFTRVIYTFADPVDVVFSVITQGRKHGRVWLEDHCCHMRAPISEIDNIQTVDALRLERHFKAWMQPQAFPVMLVKYNAIWDHLDDISDFLGMTLELPPYRPRQTRLDLFSSEEVARVRDTYARLYRLVDDAPAFQYHDAVQNRESVTGVM